MTKIYFPLSRRLFLLSLMIYLWPQAVQSQIQQSPNPEAGELKAYRISDSISDAQMGFAVSGCSDLWCDFQGNLFLVLEGENRVMKISPLRKVLAQTGGFGFGPRQFNRPIAIASNDGGLNLYVLDSENRRVVRLNSTLNWIDEIDLEAAPNGREMGKPHDLAINSAGEIFISDPQNCRVIKLNLQGKFTGELIGPKRPINPNKLAFDKRDYLYVCDVSVPDLKVYDDLGNFVLAIGTGLIRSVDFIRVDEQHIYLGDSVQNAILVFDKKGILSAMLAGNQSGGAQAAFPGAIADGPGERIWVADQIARRITAYDPVKK